MKEKIKRWLLGLLLKLMENRTIRTWTICFALRHAPVKKILDNMGVNDDAKKS